MISPRCSFIGGVGVAAGLRTGLRLRVGVPGCPNDLMFDEPGDLFPQMSEILGDMLTSSTPP